METIVVDRGQLSEQLKKNLEKHRAEYSEALEGFISKRAEAAVDVGVAAAACISTVETYHDLNMAWKDYQEVIHNRPIDRSGSYEQAIELMKWQRKEEFEISINDFECYVRDNWSWRSDHNSKYLSNRR